jgi:phage shock protein PspC (stress-responsive transcriptional regulator)
MDDMNEQRDTPGAPQQGNATGTADAPGASGPRVTGQQMRDVNRLRRSRSDRYLAGVAGGLGRHFDIDPTVIRVLLVALTFFGGAGILVYVVVWLFVPEDGAERAPVDLNPDLLKVVLIGAGAVALMIVFGTPFFNHSWGWGFPIPLLVIGLVVVAIIATRDQRRRTAPAPPPPWGAAPPTATTPGPVTPASSAPQEGTPMGTTDTLTDPAASGYRTGHQTGYQGNQPPPAWMPPPPPAYVPPPRPRRTGLVLFWPTLAMITIGMGVLGIVDASNSVQPSAYVALAVAIIAVMLVIGAFVGRPGGLIALGIVASLGLGVASAVEASTDWQTGGESLQIAPTSSVGVQDSYSVPNGRIDLDLSGVRDVAALDGRRIDAHLFAGEIHLTLPPGVNAVVDADVHFAGNINIDGSERSGFDQQLTRTITGSTDPEAPTVRLDLDVRAGQITVDHD